MPGFNPEHGDLVRDLDAFLRDPLDGRSPLSFAQAVVLDEADAYPQELCPRDTAADAGSSQNGRPFRQRPRHVGARRRRLPGADNQTDHHEAVPEPDRHRVEREVLASRPTDGRSTTTKEAPP